ncbi:MAG: acetyl-CoA carboxylase biotin carboxyl carrier protein [Alphaproteobacteria bacterium]|nr:acetyl-CoA carboxylase biotin carboxyl carrier protein [Alphaproteobacteria bacterium]MCL2889890.1 acetyl-CoA carboxylase biotin carboxyl carrier protein [Alphaproteobacteria bacterium]
MSAKTIEKMSKMMDKMGLTELKTESSFLFGVFRKEIHLSKQQNIIAAAAPQQFTANAASAAPLAATNDAPVAPAANALRSPMVGVAYLSPEPGALPFIEIGKKVKAGDTLVLIEAMKTFNPVKADKDGTIKEILIKDGQAVEFDTPLVVVG